MDDDDDVVCGITVHTYTLHNNIEQHFTMNIASDALRKIKKKSNNNNNCKASTEKCVILNNMYFNVMCVYAFGLI